MGAPAFVWLGSDPRSRLAWASIIATSLALMATAALFVGPQSLAALAWALWGGVLLLVVAGAALAIAALAGRGGWGGWGGSIVAVVALIYAVSVAVILVRTS